MKTGATIPGGGKLVIGQQYSGSKFVANRGFLGQITGVNIWDTSLTGEELEDLARSPDNGRGNILRWFQVLKNVHGAAEIATPSEARNTSKNFKLYSSFQKIRISFFSLHKFDSKSEIESSL